MKHLFIVGAQRSGSTYLYQLLDSHPQVAMAQPVRPEPKFFLKENLYRRGVQYYEQTYFSSVSPQTLYLGEKGTSYIESTEAAKRIYRFYPDARILIILRDPAQRAWSNYRFSVQHGLEHLSFEAALAAEPERLLHAQFSTSVNPYAYRQRGHYVDYLAPYLNVFLPEQVQVVIFEELAGRLPETQALYRQLGIDDSFVPPMLHSVVNAASKEGQKPVAALRELADEYEVSVRKLEQVLGRSLDIWRRAWAESV